jgi:putative transposase
MHEDEAMKIALFRYQVIAPLFTLEDARGSLKTAIRRRAAETHLHPRKGPTRYAYATIEEWFYHYRNHGLDALKPCPRKDRGQSRKIDDATADVIEQLAEGHPDLDGPGLLAELRTSVDPLQVPSLSTLYRFLHTRGLDQRQAPARRDHRAYAFEFAGECWQSDVMYGPSLATREGTRRRVYLLAVMDDATRLVPHAQFYFEQHLRCLKDCLKQALLKRGVPVRFYCDNGKIFRSRLMLQVGARLGMHIVHSRPYRPQGRAKIERWFRRVRTTFLRRLDLDAVEDLEHLNRLFLAWVEGDYHQTPHRGLEGETPLDCWMRLSEGIRPLPADVDLEALFREETHRRVAKDGTLRLHSHTFEAGPCFIGQRVAVRFDPFDLRRIEIVGADGRSHAAFPVDLLGNRFVRRGVDPDARTKTPSHPPPLKSLEARARKMDPGPPRPGTQGEPTS